MLCCIYFLRNYIYDLLEIIPDYNNWYPYSNMLPKTNEFFIVKSVAQSNFNNKIQQQWLILWTACSSYLPPNLISILSICFKTYTKLPYPIFYHTNNIITFFFVPIFFCFNTQENWIFISSVFHLELTFVGENFVFSVLNLFQCW